MKANKKSEIRIRLKTMFEEATTNKTYEEDIPIAKLQKAPFHLFIQNSQPWNNH